MATANPSVMARRDGFWANPWIWMSVGMGLTLWSWAWTLKYGENVHDNHVIALAAGLILVGSAVAIRLNSNQPVRLNSLPLPTQSLLALVLACFFFLIAGGATAAVVSSYLGSWTYFLKPGLTTILWLIIFPALLAAALTCFRRFSRQEPLDRDFESALLIIMGCGSCLVGCGVLYLGEAEAKQWDTMRFFLQTMAGVTLFGAALCLASSKIRRCTVSLIILFHFGGITTATLAAPPTPWIITQIWLRVYRPYLEFMYLNNAYHFYAPEPGPSRFLWFRIIYTDADQTEHGEWFKVPSQDNEGLHQHSVAVEYQRYLAMAESVAFAEAGPPMYLIDDQGNGKVNPFFANRMACVPSKRHVIAGVEAPRLEIPLHPFEQDAAQYSIPNQSSRLLLSSFARHVARRPHPEDINIEDPEARKYKFHSVKVYEIVHKVMSPEAFVQKRDAREPINYRPYYVGEFDAEGNLIPSTDPFMYWLLPILEGTEKEIYNHAARHAGDPNWVFNPTTQTWGTLDEFRK